MIGICISLLGVSMAVQSTQKSWGPGIVIFAGIGMALVESAIWLSVLGT